MGENSQSTLVSLLPLVLFIGVIYFLMIRPQKKKDRAINDMRRSLTVGDEIVTIGGICGKIVKTKDETIVLQVGADKVKMEMMRWAVSSITKEAPSKQRSTHDDVEEDEPKKPIKKLRRSASKSEVEETVEETVNEVLDTEESADIQEDVSEVLEDK